MADEVVVTKEKMSKWKLFYYISLLFLLVFFVKSLIFTLEFIRKTLHGATGGPIFYVIVVLGCLISLSVFVLNENDINLIEMIKEYFLNLF